MKEEKKQSEFEINRTYTYQPNFETNSGLFSRFFFCWVREIISAGNRKHLDQQDLSDLRENEQPRYDFNKFKQIFYLVSQDTKNKLIVAFWRYFGWTFVSAGVLATLANLMQYSGPLMLNRILNFLNKGDEPLENGIIYVSVMIVCYLLKTLLMAHAMHRINTCCSKVLNSANSLVYDKILTVSSASRNYLEAGAIMTHINVDIMSFYYFIMMSSFIFSAPIMITTGIVLLIVEVGWIGLIAPALFSVGLFLQNKIMQKGYQLRKDQLFWTDRRTKCVNQYFGGIRIIKYYGWQPLVDSKIQEIRAQQLKLIFKGLMYRTYIDVIMNMLPIFASITIFGLLSGIDGPQAVTPAKVFTVLAIFNLIATPMRLIVMSMIQFINAKASLTRVDHFFQYENRSLDGFETNDTQLQIGDISMKNCIFEWDKKEVKEHFEKGKVFAIKTSQQKKDQQKPKKDEVDKSEEKKKKKKKKKTDTSDLKEDESGIRKSIEKKKKKKKKKITESEDSLTEGLLNKSQKGSSISSSSVSVSSQKKIALQVEKLDIYRGQFVSIIGRVGSGKSTFLYSVLGEIDKPRGSVNRRGSVAYIPQVSWLRSATIRENIIFESEFDEARYNHILKISELESDLQILQGGDLTEIGEKGLNLSGGQKQRISIARALYANADIYLIDDCLSALDPYVGKNIFYNVLKDYLHSKGKTIIFVTNAIHFTEETDRIIIMDEGRIVEDGSPLDLKEAATFAELALAEKKSKQRQEEEEIELEKQKEEERKKSEDDILKIAEDEEEEVTVDSKKDKDKDKKDAGNLVKVEERLKGSVPWRFYYRFFAGPGALRATLMFLFITLAQMARVLSDWWLGQWGSNSLSLQSNTYIGVYAGISILVGILIFIKGIVFARFIIASSRVVQRRLITALLKSPLSWFDVTPTGRIISRATKDQDDLDNNLAFNIQFATQNLLVLISSIVLVSVATPIYLVVAFLSGIVYYKLIGYYLNSSREIKRLEANSRAPLITHISETINGIYVVRAFNKTDKFFNRYFQRQKAYLVTIINQNTCNRWINIVTDVFSVVTIAASGYFGVISVAVNLGSTSSNLVGLALVWALNINGLLNFTLRVMADTESCMNSVVRLYEYIDGNPSEKSFEDKKPAVEWPVQGKYQIENASYRYRPDLPLVLKNLSFDIKRKERIGIVGRTGSGKSTMTLAFLRILEMAENEDSSMGSINLDNEDISDIGLHVLRHNVTIIPQDPTLFTGTIKSNIDPFGDYSDTEVADTLKKVSLWDQINDNTEETTEIRKKIYSKVSESGSNFSLGQRQLMCMARALIKKPKVLLMDEATASIDQKTDEFIQKMIRTEFKNTTVITIAHRLNTIVFYDKILVLERGEIKEYDTPLKLVKDPESFLGKLIRKTGESYMKRIVELAEKTFEKEE